MPFDMKSNSHGRAGLALAAVVCVLLHLAIAPNLSLLGGRFNFMLVLVAALSVSNDSRIMVYVGFFAGLFFDLTTASPVGLMALLLALCGYVCGLMSRGLGGGLGMESVRMAAIAVLGVHLAYAVALFALGVESSLLLALTAQLVSAVLDLLACVPVLMLGGGPGSGSGFSPRRKQGMPYGGKRLKVLK